MNCTKCDGTGIKAAYTIGSYTSPQSECVYCKGTGTFDEPDYGAIRATIFTNKGTLKSSISSYNVPHRAYYVWRLARFHGGKDPTMPMTAMILIEGDPYKDDLDKFADSVAVTAFGSNMRAAARWGKALGYFG